MLKKFPQLRQIGSKKRSEIASLNDAFFSNGLETVKQYSIVLMAKKLNEKGKPIASEPLERKYILEIHYYPGFGMIKYYPRHHKNHPDKYKLRARQLKYELYLESLRLLMDACTYLMKDYLDCHKENFIGYIGQPDPKDDKNKNQKDTSKRARVYNRWVFTKFQSHKYAFVDPSIFKEVNINLVRVTKKGERSLTREQESNYNCFTEIFDGSHEKVLDFMTTATREKALKSQDNS